METKTLQVTGYEPTDGLTPALKGADVVLIPAGVPRKPGMTRDGMGFDHSLSLLRLN